MQHGHTIYHDLHIEASLNEVFDAVSLPAHLNNWWTLKCTGQPELGSTYNLYFAPEYDWYGEVSACVPNRSFHIKMTKSDPDWEPTTFGFDLEAMEGGKVRLKFSHQNWPVCNAHFRHSSYCWAMLLHYLKNYLERGIIIPFEERE